jgi:hypothetical protein
LKEAIGRIDIPSNHSLFTFETTIYFQQVIGHDVVVQATDWEEIFFAVRPGNDFLSRFVRKEPVPTKCLTLKLKQLDKNIPQEWMLVSSYAGESRFPEIDFYEGVGPTLEQLNYWNAHAFCWGYVAIIPGTLTESCPWEP